MGPYHVCSLWRAHINAHIPRISNVCVDNDLGLEGTDYKVLGKSLMKQDVLFENNKRANFGFTNVNTFNCKCIASMLQRYTVKSLFVAALK